MSDLRSAIEVGPRHATLKRILGRQGLSVQPCVRAPLRDLDEPELRRFEAWCAEQSIGA
jgi:dihydrodipicolinate synthase/N-acetylneuraminate lyase